MCACVRPLKDNSVSAISYLESSSLTTHAGPTAGQGERRCWVRGWRLMAGNRKSFTVANSLVL